MKYASFTRRIISGIIDFTILFILFNMFCIWFFTSDYGIEMYSQILPFVIMTMLLFPMDSMFKMYKYPAAYGDVTIFVKLYIVFFVIEVLYYFLFEILPTKGTIGHICTRTRVYKTSDCKIGPIALLSRGVFKTLSRYIFALPLLAILLTNKKQSIYDMMIHSIVVVQEKHNGCVPKD